MLSKIPTRRRQSSWLQTSKIKKGACLCCMSIPLIRMPQKSKFVVENAKRGQSPIFPWHFQIFVHALIELPPSWFVTASASWRECLNYQRILAGVHFIRWIAVYPLETAIRSLNKWGQMFRSQPIFRERAKLETSGMFFRVFFGTSPPFTQLSV